MNKINLYLNKTFLWIYRLMIANILWFFFSLLGILVGGIFPATNALFAICRKWMRGYDFPIYKTYKEYYKKDFKNANILGYIMLGITVILILDYMYFSSGTRIYSLYLSYLFIFLIIFQLLASSAIYAIYNNYELSLKDILKFTFLYSFSYLITAIILTATLVIVIYIIYQSIPPLIIFLGVSLPVLVIVFITNINLRKIKKENYTAKQLLE